MTRMQLTAIVAISASIGLPRIAGGQCTEGNWSVRQRLAAGLKSAVAIGAAEFAERGVRDTPRAAALNDQTSAPSGTGADATIVDAAGFTQLISAAFDQSVGSDASDAVTLNLNPFMLAAVGNPDLLYDQQQYEKREFEILRRFAATATFGGAGDPVDRDGDGTIEDAIAAENFDDIVGWEVRYRLWGSRDRRDPANFRIFENEVTNAPRDLLADDQLAQFRFLADSRKTLESITGNPDMEACLTDKQWLTALEDPTVKKRYAEYIEATTKLNSAYAKAADLVDNAMVWTIAATGVSRDDKYGGDKYGASLRGSWKAATFNLDWQQMDGIAGSDDINQLKIALEYATQILQGRYFTDGIDASLGASYELFDNVPGALHDDNVKIQAQLDFPILNGVTVPLSLTWANHADLLEDSDRVYGRIGLTVDTSRLLAQVQGSPER